jgi:hypothetical protein
MKSRLQKIHIVHQYAKIMCNQRIERTSTANIRLAEKEKNNITITTAICDRSSI